MEIITKLKTLVAQEKALSIEILQLLREVEDQKIYLERSYPTLFAFVVEELGFSADEAYRRIGAMRLIRRVPEVAEKLASGAMTLSSAAHVQTVLRAQRQLDPCLVVSAVSGKSTREVDKILRTMAPEAARP